MILSTFIKQQLSTNKKEPGFTWNPAFIIFFELFNNQLKFHDTRRFSEAAKCSGRVLEIEDFSVRIISGIHALEFRVGFEHVDLGFTAVIADERSRKAEPLGAGFVHGAKLDFAVFLDLLRDVLGLACLDVKLAFENFDGTERADFRFVAVNCRQEIGAA